MAFLRLNRWRFYSRLSLSGGGIVGTPGFRSRSHDICHTNCHSNVGFFAFLVFLRWSPPVTTFGRFRPVLFRYIRLRNCADPICGPPPLPMFLHICVTNLNVACELLLLIQTRSELSYYFVSGFVLLPCWKICVCDGNHLVSSCSCQTTEFLNRWVLANQTLFWISFFSVKPI